MYMAIKHIDQIASQLIAAGRNVDEPVAIVANASTKQQRVLETTLLNAAKAISESAIEPPAIIVVGQVVRLRAGLDWLGALTGKKLHADPLNQTIEEKQAG